MISLERILVPTDFSEPSEKALQYAKALGGLVHASLHLLHVVEEPFVHAWTVEGYVASLPDWRNAMEMKAREDIERLLSEEERVRLRALLAIRVGHPFTVISRYAQEQSVDLIVMGTHGRGGMAKLLLGSVAEKLVRAAPCPVLTVRHGEHDFVIP
jgi:nucleotide-binding universal stress UspA family protein